MQKMSLFYKKDFVESAKKCFALIPSDSPEFDAVFWKTEEANCYNYATGNLEGWRRPGEYSRTVRWDILDPEEEGDGDDAPKVYSDDVYFAAVKAGARADGLVPVKDPSKPHPGYYVVALVFRPGGGSQMRDFHWYRLDKSGTWSHKMGDLNATAIDGMGGVIEDPAKLRSKFSNHGYGIFGGYWLVPNTGLGSMPCFREPYRPRKPEIR